MSNKTSNGSASQNEKPQTQHEPEPPATNAVEHTAQADNLTSGGHPLPADWLRRIVFIWIGYYGFRYVAYSSAAKTFALQLNKGLVASIIPISACLNILRCIQKLVREHIPALKNAGKKGGK